MWLDPHADWKSKLYERLLEKRIVLASGFLDDDAAARLSAQLLTLDAEQKEPIRLELQNLRAELSAVLTVMGILDVLRVPVHACVSGEINGPALGVLASCPRRSGYPNATFVLTEPKLQFGGTVTALTAREQQVTRMLDTLYFRLAEVTGREVDEIREDARRGRTLTTAQAIGYGLIQTQEPQPPAAPAPALAPSAPTTTMLHRRGYERGTVAALAQPEKLPSVHARSQSVTSNRGLSRWTRKREDRHTAAFARNVPGLGSVMNTESDQSSENRHPGSSPEEERQRTGLFRRNDSENLMPPWSVPPGLMVPGLRAPDSNPGRREPAGSDRQPDGIPAARTPAGCPPGARRGRASQRRARR